MLFRWFSKSSHRTDRRPRGVAIAVVMLLLLMVLSFTAASGLITKQNYTNAAFRERTLEAQYAFRAGLSTAMERLTSDPTWAPTELAPYQDYLDPGNRVGFRVWLDGINPDSATPVTSVSGLTLGRGQAALRVLALVNGQEIVGGFGGAEATQIITRPPVEFENNLMGQDAGTGLPVGASGARFLSYNSSTALMPYLGAAPVPAANRHASLRSVGDISLGPSTVVEGDLFLPTNGSVSAGAGSYQLATRLDTAYLPRRFVPPDALVSAPVGTADTSAPIPPGHYLSVAANPGTPVELQRGGTYYFDNIQINSNAELRVVGPPTDGPCVVYLHTFGSGSNARINLPVAGQPPIPADLQLYGVPQVDCDIPDFTLGPDAQAALLWAGYNSQLVLGTNAVLYGALIGSTPQLQNGVSIHYDQALAGEEFAGQTEWVLISQGMR